MAVIVELAATKAGIPAQWRLFLTTGVLGGFTTFSSFSLDTIMIFERGQVDLAVFYILVPVGLSLLTFLAGVAVVRGTVGAFL